MTQPTLRFIQLLLIAARDANLIKYWSQLGLRRSSLVKFSVSRDRCSWFMELDEFNSRSWARSIILVRPIVGLYRWWSLWITKSSRLWVPLNAVAGFPACLSCSLRHRRPTGASTLISMKKGRLSSTSRVVSSQMSVVTHLSFQCFVTWFNRASKSENFNCASPSPRSSCSEGMDFNVEALVLAIISVPRVIERKPCWWMR